jgi:hypothetical protein
VESKRDKLIGVVTRAWQRAVDGKGGTGQGVQSSGWAAAIDSDDPLHRTVTTTNDNVVCVSKWLNKWILNLTTKKC